MLELLEDLAGDVAFIVGLVLAAVFALVVSVVLVMGLVWLFYGSDPDPMMQKCMADGHKDYECVGILRGRR